MKVQDILKLKGNRMLSASPGQTLSDAVILMAEEDIGSLVVLDNNRLAGMLTFREILVVLAKRQKEQRVGPTPTMNQILVNEVMNPRPTQVAPDMTIDTLREVMNRCGERYLPVMEGDAILGVVSFHDVARAVLDAQSFENRMLKAYIRDWPAEGDAEGSSDTPKS
nr:Arabinose 5-phosphate isomerase KdsD [Cupriavidus sp.]